MLQLKGKRNILKIKKPAQNAGLIMYSCNVYYTAKLSPQPQVRLALGLLK